MLHVLKWNGCPTTKKKLFIDITETVPKILPNLRLNVLEYDLIYKKEDCFMGFLNPFYGGAVFSDIVLYFLASTGLKIFDFS